MQLSFGAESTASDVFENVAKYLSEKKFSIASEDRERPWGGFFVISETEAEKFIAEYFPAYKKSDLLLADKLSPKILIVAPAKKLSWQYHHRRAEIWKLIGGEAKVVTSDNDEEKDEQILTQGDIVQLPRGQRHRLIGTGQWGIVAEIWQHTDRDAPSDENDIVRVQDDFGR